VQVHSTLDGVLTLTIYDALGKIVSQESITVKKGYTLINQDINVATGRYFISAQLNNGQYYDYNYILIGR
jgi:folate-dependent tRNA-U54 methylase TrmFO/GidA